MINVHEPYDFINHPLRIRQHRYASLAIINIHTSSFTICVAYYPPHLIYKKHGFPAKITNHVILKLCVSLLLQAEVQEITIPGGAGTNRYVATWRCAARGKAKQSPANSTGRITRNQLPTYSIVEAVA